VAIDGAGNEILQEMPAMFPNEGHGGAPLRERPQRVN
jgi:hypothetical protein